MARQITTFFTVLFLAVACEQVPQQPISEPASYMPVEVAGEIATKAERDACEAVGGEIMRDGLAGWERCTQTYPDAGAQCSDTSDCIGRCLAAADVTDMKADPVIGQCEKTDSPFGCFEEIKNGAVTHALCVD